MTREEARVILKEMHDYMHDGYMTHLAHGGKQDGTIEDDIEALSVAIEALSQPERPKGRWIETCVPDVYQCSHCKKATKMDELCNSETLRNYCPNCGADMRGEEE